MRTPGTILGKYVRSRREELGLSQVDIDRTTNGAVPAYALSRIETGAGSTSPDVLMSLAPVIQTPVDYLYRLAGWLPEEHAVREPAPVDWQDWRDVVMKHPELQKVPVEARRLAVASLEVWLREAPGPPG